MPYSYHIKLTHVNNSTISIRLLCSESNTSQLFFKGSCLNSLYLTDSFLIGHMEVRYSLLYYKLWVLLMYSIWITVLLKDNVVHSIECVPFKSIEQLVVCCTKLSTPILYVWKFKPLSIEHKIIAKLELFKFLDDVLLTIPEVVHDLYIYNYIVWSDNNASFTHTHKLIWSHTWSLSVMDSQLM